jgi:RimJ/RimL family protein N-acetyltransferase
MKPTLVTLRDVVADDIPIFYRHQIDPVSVALAHVPPRDRAAHTAHWQQLLTDATVGKQTVLFNGTVAGQVISFNRDGIRELGYRLGRDFWGRGIAGAAVALYLAVYELHRPLFAFVVDHNIASQRILLRCGFVARGRIDEFLRFELP